MATNPNTYTANSDDTTTLNIRRRNGDLYSLTIDTADAPAVSRRIWWIQRGHHGTAYAATSGPERTAPIFLHRFIDETPAEMLCHFRDRNPMNCRRSNLERVRDQTELQANRKAIPA